MTSLNSLNSNTISLLLPFLKSKELFRLERTSKYLHALLKDHKGRVVKQFFKDLTEDQDTFLNDLYEEEAYMIILKSFINTTSRISNTTFDLFRDFKMALYRFREYLQAPDAHENSQKAVNLIREALERPLLPSHPIKRSHQVCETFSQYQTFLNDVYHQLNSESELIDTSCNNYEKTFIFEAHLLSVENEDFHNQQIFQARWLMKIDEPTVKILETNQNQRNGLVESPLIQTFKLLQSIFKNFCGLIASYLDSISNPFLFISEYGCKWKNYVVSMQTIGGFLRHFSQVMNQIYQERHPEYPGHPIFSIWRMMAKIWYSEVFVRLESKLLESFQIVFADYLSELNSNIKKMTNTEKGGLFLTSNTSDLDKDLFEPALRTLWNSMIDLATNEINVSQLVCSDRLADLKSTSKFFSAVKNIVATRCKTFVEDQKFRSSKKFKTIRKEAELIQDIIPQTIFPEIYNILVESQQKVLVDSILKLESPFGGDEIQNFIKSCKVPKKSEILNWMGLESIVLSYPEMMTDVNTCRKNIERLISVEAHRAKKKQANKRPILTGLQARLLELHETIETELVEKCKESLEKRIKNPIIIEKSVI